MRLAVISDVHGNLVALEAVLADIRRRGADLIVNCGDLCNSPLWPRETLELLLSLDLPTVRGNHDRWMAELPPEKMSPALRYTHGQLSQAQRATLGALPAERRIEGDVYMCHGSPKDDCEYLLEEGHEGTLALARADVIGARLAGVDATLVVCGHSHNAGMTWAPGGQTVVNPGSVGCPVFADNPQAARNNCRAPHARYAMVTRTSGGWSVDLIALAYDWARAAARARANGELAWARSYETGNV
jgi:predicted phosphodiesterase